MTLASSVLVFQLGSVNGTGARNAREIRTKNQLLKSEMEPMYQNEIHRQLLMVDALEKVGISRHFAAETKVILDATYRYACCPQVKVISLPFRLVIAVSCICLRFLKRVFDFLSLHTS
jgi:hypothetical protein